MTWAWLAWVTDPPEGRPAGDVRSVAPLARAGLTSPAGLPLGELIAWPAGRRPDPEAVRMHAAVVDPAAEPGWISLVMIPRDRSPLFDDPAVSAALRAVLAGPAPDAVSTFVRDATHFAGAVTLRRADPARLRDDPFARLGHRLLARVDAGLLGTTPPPAGPVIQRYAGLPWPASGFPGA